MRALIGRRGAVLWGFGYQVFVIFHFFQKHAVECVCLLCSNLTPFGFSLWVVDQVEYLYKTLWKF